MLGQTVAGVTTGAGLGGGGGGGGAAGLLIVIGPPVPGDAMSLAPHAASAAQLAVAINTNEKRLNEAIKSPLRTHRLIEVSSGEWPTR